MDEKTESTETPGTVVVVSPPVSLPDSHESVPAHDWTAEMLAHQETLASLQATLETLAGKMASLESKLELLTVQTESANRTAQETANQLAELLSAAENLQSAEEVDQERPVLIPVPQIPETVEAPRSEAPPNPLARFLFGQ